MFSSGASWGDVLLMQSLQALVLLASASCFAFKQSKIC